MKNMRSFLTIGLLAFLLSSCSLWNKVFKPKEGCPSNGKNVGAEKILSGEGPKKSPKFKA
ncbi:MAG: hypothetical protein JWP27_2316 [Flaviaesturariibacter sp.]|nr:hypothetical protein [Flaviaesturariibacter sp.]